MSSTEVEQHGEGSEPAPGAEVEGPPGGPPAAAGPESQIQSSPEHPHPEPYLYVGIAVILAVVTMGEVGLYYTHIPKALFIVLLLSMAFIKFLLVASWFMHLRFDSRIFRRLFVTGIVLAISVYIIVLLTLHVFIG